MPFDENFLELMNSTVDWSPYTGEDLDGNPTYGPVVTDIPSLYEGTIGRGTAAGAPTGVLGTTPEAHYTVYIPPQVPQVRPRDKLILDTGAITYAAEVNIYQDPAYGDPGLVEVTTEEYR